MKLEVGLIYELQLAVSEPLTKLLLFPKLKTDFTIIVQLGNRSQRNDVRRATNAAWVPARHGDGGAQGSSDSS